MKYLYPLKRKWHGILCLNLDFVSMFILCSSSFNHNIVMLTTIYAWHASIFRTNILDSLVHTCLWLLFLLTTQFTSIKPTIIIVHVGGRHYWGRDGFRNSLIKLNKPLFSLIMRKINYLFIHPFIHLLLFIYLFIIYLLFIYYLFIIYLLFIYYLFISHLFIYLFVYLFIYSFIIHIKTRHLFIIIYLSFIHYHYYLFIIHLYLLSWLSIYH